MLRVMTLNYMLLIQDYDAGLNHIDFFLFSIKKSCECYSNELEKKSMTVVGVMVHKLDYS